MTAGRDHDGVTIRRRLGDCVCTNVATGTRLVVDNHRLAPGFAEFLAEQAGQCVGRAARCKRHDDAHRSGRRGLSVGLEWREQRQRVRMTVTDTGPGFAPNILQRAFEPYVTTKAKGTGLGLAVVKKIADEHGASIKLNNVPDSGDIQGAQVSLSFAVAQTAQGLEQPPS